MKYEKDFDAWWWVLNLKAYKRKEVLDKENLFNTRGKFELHLSDLMTRQAVARLTLIWADTTLDGLQCLHCLNILQHSSTQTPAANSHIISFFAATQIISCLMVWPLIDGKLFIGFIWNSNLFLLMIKLMQIKNDQMGWLRVVGKVNSEFLSTASC